jgi:hypothetical protein
VRQLLIIPVILTFMVLLLVLGATAFIIDIFRNIFVAAITAIKAAGDSLFVWAEEV